MNKTILITGASGGIGREIAFSFAKAGYCLYLTCHKNIAALKELKREIETEHHVPCFISSCDLSSEAAVEALFSTLPPLDILVNNAGISHVGLITEMTGEEWRSVLSTNLDSLFYTCKNAIPPMLRQGHGKILNISSVWGLVGASMEVAYSASKSGVNGFTKALAKELAPSNIQVNAIACGLIDTKMNASFSAEELADVISEIPADRMGEAKEIGELCVMLASSPAYLTGEIIKIDGGWC